jgi:peptidoglycan hydrolase-like protein with peptidoglycan-binding domain
MIGRIGASCAVLALALVAFLASPPGSIHAAETAPIQIAANDVTEKEAFEAAKELGTIEAWEAFLTNFSTGFRADLARAYVKQIANDPPAPAAVQPAAAPPAPAAPPASPADISMTITPNQGSCRRGAPCSYTVVATNVGGQPFTSQQVIAVGVAPLGSRLTTSGPSQWNCQEMGGGAVCSNPNANIAPGQSSTISLTFALPRKAAGAVRTCSQISWGGTPRTSSARDVQQALNDRGFNAGPADGRPGRKTTNAIRAYQQQNGLATSGGIDLPLLFSLFTQQGPGDSNANNDRACIDTTLRGAPVSTYSQPAAQPATQRSSGRGCSGGRYYSKKRRRCACPSSKPHWYNNRCYAGRDDCPGDSVRVGNNCVKENEPPVRQARPNRPPAQQPGATLPGVAVQILNQFQQQQCSGGRVRIGGKCKCPGNQTFSGTACIQNQVRQSAPVQQTAPPPPPIVKQVRPVQTAPNAPPAPPPPAPIVKKTCPGGLVPGPQGGCVAPSCGRGQIATPNGCIALSDIRLKKNVAHLATLEGGVKLYEFRYLWDDTLRVGVMAQDLLADQTAREAVVVTSSGYYAVDYRRLGLKMVTYEAWRAGGLASIVSTR